MICQIRVNIYKVGWYTGTRKRLMVGRTQTIDESHIYLLRTDLREWNTAKRSIDHVMKVTKPVILYVQSIPQRVPEYNPNWYKE